MIEYTPEQLIKLAIIRMAIEWEQVVTDWVESPDTIDDTYDSFMDDDCLYDVDNEIRESGQSTDLTHSDCSRHYESEIVAIQVDGIWVAFTYWTGGGKHGEPEAIDWMDDSFFVDVEEYKTVAYRFKKIDD